MIPKLPDELVRQGLRIFEVGFVDPYVTFYFDPRKETLICKVGMRDEVWNVVMKCKAFNKANHDGLFDKLEMGLLNWFFNCVANENLPGKTIERMFQHTKLRSKQDTMTFWGNNGSWLFLRMAGKDGLKT